MVPLARCAYAVLELPTRADAVAAMFWDTGEDWDSVSHWLVGDVHVVVVMGWLLWMVCCWLVDVEAVLLVGGCGWYVTGWWMWCVEEMLRSCGKACY